MSKRKPTPMEKVTADVLARCAGRSLAEETAALAHARQTLLAAVPRARLRAEAAARSAAHRAEAGE